MGSTFTGQGLVKLTTDLKSNKFSKKKTGISSSGSGYHHLTGIVKECVSEPDEYYNRDVKIGQNKFKLRDLIKKKTTSESKKLGSMFLNDEDLELMPKNSIIAYITDGSAAATGTPAVICYPFFPPHLSLPVKPGEHVWLIREEGHNRDVYYWLCRKSGPAQVDDVNYTHLERFSLIDGKLNELSGASSENLQEKSGGLFSKMGSSKDLPLDIVAYAAFDNANPPNLPEGMDNNSIISESSAFKEEFTCEPVPPVRKKCGDAVFQGSNNSLIHLTTEKFIPNEVDKSAFSGGAEGGSGRMPLSAAIDLCVGRKRSSLESLKGSSGDTASSPAGDISIIKTKRSGKGVGFESYEFNKVQDLDSGSSNYNPETSVDISATNCGARLYMSHNCAVDDVFESAFDVLTPRGGSSIASFADHNRIVADSSLRLANRKGESFLNFDEEGNIVMKSSINNGQQFLSLGITGTSRLQAKNKIELAVGSTNEMPLTEDYVLVSQLETLLTAISAAIKALGAGVVGAAASTIIPPTLAAAQGSANAAKSAADLSMQTVDQAISGRLLRSKKIVGC